MASVASKHRSRYGLCRGTTPSPVRVELEQAQDYRIWAYRKAAWTMDEWPESVAEIYEARGERGAP